MNYLIQFLFKLHTFKWRLLAIVFLLLAIASIFYFYYPKSVVTMGVPVGWLENGQPKPGSELLKLKNYLHANGIELKIKTDKDAATEKPTLEFLVNDPEVDFVYTFNTGAKMPEDVLNKFSSLGSVSKQGIWFYVKTGRSNIKNFKDLKGKKLIFWSTPEGNAEPAFSSKNSQASIYSSDYILENLFKQVGITAENTQLTNVWPNKVNMSQDWDVWITFSFPSKTSHSSELWEELLSGKIELLQIHDLEGVGRRLPHLKYGQLPASAHLPSRALPKENINYLSFTRNVIVRDDLDPSIVMLLAEFQKKNASAQTVLNDKDQYPNFSQEGSFKPNKTAEDFYANGRPFLSQHLSPGLSAFLIKILLVLVPALTILWPITHFVPSIYHFYVKHKITHWYRDLEFIERNFLKSDDDARALMKSKLEEIQLGLQELKFPVMHLHYVQEIFIAKEHVELIRKRYNL